ncbi:ExbD/TolR family protein [Neptunomonas antarctica]|uniref:Biopolymer transport protein ExbD n=1 Tax=Neptunomonas antarctica TaxID=619304 RepID=A0A1N7IZ05_9GAMM|nr:biopolymer transporter ExbD [Neptunomonas antarctica]SIS42328.1 biopolymer transport protein ExbD [Neptunomonas antarctica]
MQLDLQPVRRRQAISLTPLIDVVFILLLFFMLSSSFMQWRQIDLSAAQASNNTSSEVHRLRLISDQGLIEHGGQRYQMQDAVALHALVLDAPEAVFAIEVAPGVMTQTMITLLDNLKQAGAQHVSLAGVLP